MYNSIIVILTNIMKSSKLSKLKMREARFWHKMKFETIFFQVLWQFFNPKGSLPQAGGRGVWSLPFRPPYKFWAKSVRIFSNALRSKTRVSVGFDNANFGISYFAWRIPPSPLNFPKVQSFSLLGMLNYT